MKLYSNDGVEMMEVKSIDQQGDVIVIKGKMMKSMAAVIHVKPADVWAAYKLFPKKLIFSLPTILWKGRRATKTP